MMNLLLEPFTAVKQCLCVSLSIWVGKLQARAGPEEARMRYSKFVVKQVTCCYSVLDCIL
jgi:hypothetical protein